MFGGILMVLMFVVALFLILLVLIQRGRGGGLAGAFGGMGGQSAFGTKAGDLFTRITIIVAAIWVLLCVLGVKYYNVDDKFSSSLGGAAKSMDFGMPGPGTATSPATPPGAAGTATTGAAGTVETGTSGTVGTAPAGETDTKAAAPATTEAPATEGAPAPDAATDAPK
ncbi:MAG TPA: preprotein translocase subunit SecG [Pirellulales bacterium]|jgi:preprotein translocase subunit SecG